MEASLQERVLAFVSEQTGVKGEKIRLETTLSRDLGIEGDDAVEFFEKFRTKFAVDLQELGRDWSFYFCPEGLPISTALIVFVPAIPIALVLIQIFPRVPDWLWFIAALVFWVSLVGFWENWRERKAKHPQVTVQDLIDCAHSGVWTKGVPADAVKRFAQYRPYGGLGSWFTR
jgi:hypothetical protein